MWEFWRSRLSKGKTRHRRRGSDDDSPSTVGSGDLMGLTGIEPENSTHVYFKDVILPASDDSEGDESEAPSAEGELTPEALARRTSRQRPARVDRQKLIIILVGLPGRGKTFLCNKLMCYLNWLGHETRHINVGAYRRSQRGAEEVQDASFFDHNNPAGREARERALNAALEDLDTWLRRPDSQVAIFDATNSTEQRRNFLRQRFHGRWQYLFIESICNDPQVLEQNYRYKMMFSPDYRNSTDPDDALNDFKERIRKYEEVYETITDRSMHYIKLIDMVTGRGYMDINRISGYIPGKMVFFLMQVCKAGLSRMRKIWLTRHGQSEYNVHGKIGGDSPLSPQGEMYARLLPDALVERIPLTADGNTMPVSVWTSTLARTIQTAELLPFPKLRWKVLDEIQAGIFDGMTYEEIEEHMPEEFSMRKKDKLRYRYPSGESYLDVIQRLEPVIIEIERERECVCVVAHQAVLRALYGYFTKTPLQEIPRLEIPLHTLIELVPRPDGTMAEERIPFDLTHDGPLQRMNTAEMHNHLAAPMTPFTPLSDGAFAPGSTAGSLGRASASASASANVSRSASSAAQDSASQPTLKVVPESPAASESASAGPPTPNLWPAASTSSSLSTALSGPASAAPSAASAPAGLSLGLKTPSQLRLNQLSLASQGSTRLSASVWHEPKGMALLAGGASRARLAAAGVTPSASAPADLDKLDQLVSSSASASADGGSVRVVDLSQLDPKTGLPPATDI